MHRQGRRALHRGDAVLHRLPHLFEGARLDLAHPLARDLGTASQAIKALEAGGYLVRQRSEADGRSVSLRLTNKGKKALARDPFEVLVRAVDSLDAKEQTVMHHALHQVLTTVAANGAHRRFGACQDCTYLGGECCNLTSASPSALNCLLFGVPIEPADAGLLCVHFQPKSKHREDGHRE